MIPAKIIHPFIFDRDLVAMKKRFGMRSSYEDPSFAIVLEIILIVPDWQTCYCCNLSVVKKSNVLLTLPATCSDPKSSQPPTSFHFAYWRLTEDIYFSILGDNFLRLLLSNLLSARKLLCISQSTNPGGRAC